MTGGIACLRYMIGDGAGVTDWVADEMPGAGVKDHAGREMKPGGAGLGAYLV